jgi:hypothetical protein
MKKHWDTFWEETNMVPHLKYHVELICAAYFSCWRQNMAHTCATQVKEEKKKSLLLF